MAQTERNIIVHPNAQVVGQPRLLFWSPHELDFFPVPLHDEQVRFPVP